MQNEDYGHFDEPRGTEDIDLAQFDDDFAPAEVEEREFETIPDGKYQVNVERVELTRAQTSGNPMLKWTLRILAPKFRGRLLWRNNVMATRENIKWLTTDLHTCGLDLTSSRARPTWRSSSTSSSRSPSTRGENRTSTSTGASCSKTAETNTTRRRATLCPF